MYCRGFICWSCRVACRLHLKQLSHFLLSWYLWLHSDLRQTGTLSWLYHANGSSEIELNGLVDDIIHSDSKGYAPYYPWYFDQLKSKLMRDTCTSPLSSTIHTIVCYRHIVAIIIYNHLKINLYAGCCIVDIKIDQLKNIPPGEKGCYFTDSN